MRDRGGLHWHLHWGFGECADAAWDDAPWQQMGKHRVCALAASDVLAFVLREHTSGGAGADEFGQADTLDHRCFALATDLLRVPSSAADNDGLTLRYPPECGAADCLAGIESLLRHCRVRIEQSPSVMLAPVQTTLTKPLWRRLVDGWERYCDALGASTLLFDRLSQLPSYLMGRWDGALATAIPAVVAATDTGVVLLPRVAPNTVTLLE